MKNLIRHMIICNLVIKNSLCVLLMLSYYCTYSQNCGSHFLNVEPGSKLDCIQGIHSPINDNNPNSETYLITKGFKTMSLILKKNGEDRQFYELNIGYEGFYNFSEYADNFGSYAVVDSFYLCNLRQNGPHYVTFLEKHIKPNGWVISLTTQPEYFCDGSFIESSDRHLTMFEPVSYLPYTAYFHLKEQSEKAARDYVKEFDVLDKLKKARVETEKAHFYSQPDENTKRKAFVIKGDKVIIDKITKNWVKAAYEGGTIITLGWLKVSDLKILE